MISHNKTSTTLHNKTSTTLHNKIYCLSDKPVVDVNISKKLRWKCTITFIDGSVINLDSKSISKNMYCTKCVATVKCIEYILDEYRTSMLFIVPVDVEVYKNYCKFLSKGVCKDQIYEKIKLSGSEVSLDNPLRLLTYQPRIKMGAYGSVNKYGTLRVRK